MSNLKPFIFGVAVGAVVIPMLGFGVFGWTFESKAERMAHLAASAEIQRVLVPVCVARFKADPEAADHIIAFKAKTLAFPREEYIESGGWATLPGQDQTLSGLARSCADALKAEL